MGEWEWEWELEWELTPGRQAAGAARQGDRASQLATRERRRRLAPGWRLEWWGQCRSTC